MYIHVHVHVHVCTCMYMCMYKCMYVCIYYTYSIFSIHIATSFNNRPFSGNVGVSAYSGEDRLLLIGESIVVTAHGMLHVHVVDDNLHTTLNPYVTLSEFFKFTFHLSPR